MAVISSIACYAPLGRHTRASQHGPNCGPRVVSPQLLAQEQNKSATFCPYKILHFNHTTTILSVTSSTLSCLQLSRSPGIFKAFSEVIPNPLNGQN